jgi:hypothetical protein
MSTVKVELPNGQEVLGGAILMLKGALKLETVGMQRHGQSAYAQTKELFGFKGSKKKVLDQLQSWIDTNLLGK